MSYYYLCSIDFSKPEGLRMSYSITEDASLALKDFMADVNASALKLGSSNVKSIRIDLPNIIIVKMASNNKFLCLLFQSSQYEDQLNDHLVDDILYIEPDYNEEALKDDEELDYEPTDEQIYEEYLRTGSKF